MFGCFKDFFTVRLLFRLCITMIKNNFLKIFDYFICRLYGYFEDSIFGMNVDANLYKIRLFLDLMFSEVD